jgi:hypothetical protein
MDGAKVTNEGQRRRCGIELAAMRLTWADKERGQFGVWDAHRFEHLCGQARPGGRTAGVFRCYGTTSQAFASKRHPEAG